MIYVIGDRETNIGTSGVVFRFGLFLRLSRYNLEAKYRSRHNQHRTLVCRSFRVIHHMFDYYIPIYNMVAIP